jgi:hypothetical protein
MLTIAGALVEHSLRIMFFRHNGFGLPATRGGALYLLTAAAVIARIVKEATDPTGFSALTAAVGTAVYLLLIMSAFRPPTLAAVLLANLFGYLVLTGLHLCGIADGYFGTGVVLWEVAALFVVMNKIVSRKRTERKNNPPPKN